MTPALSIPFCVAVVAAAAPIPAVRAARTDDRIVAAARDSYNFRTYLKDDRIALVAKQGAVTLTGEVQDEFHKVLAEATVAGLPGVRSVNNQLNVREEPGGINPDTLLRARVQAALLLHRELRPVKAQVQVAKGVVTLQGQADTRARKKLAEACVQDLDGVVRVDNQLEVTQESRPRRREIRKKIDDASITAQVKLALLFNKATSALSTKVHTDGGVVHLAGTARSREERDRVTRIVKNIEGIRGVRNQIAVAP